MKVDKFNQRHPFGNDLLFIAGEDILQKKRPDSLIKSGLLFVLRVYYFPIISVFWMIFFLCSPIIECLFEYIGKNFAK